MPNRTVSVELKALVDNYVSGMKRAKQSTTEFTEKSSKQLVAHKGNLDEMANAGAVAGGLLVAAVAAVAKTYADFDKQMSAVAATGDDAAGSLTALRGAALKAGKDTAFSATEAAAGVENLMKAGVKAQDVLNGGLTGALNLAAAGEVSVADAAETAAMALTQFHLKGSDVSHVADLLAAGAGKAQGEVSDLSQALRQSGLVASQFGLSIEDTVGTLSAFANAGLIGSDAGTSMKTMLLQLAAPSGLAAGLMEELGIAAYNTQGNFVGVTGLAGQLHDKLGSLTQAQRNQALAQIFGNDAIRSANVLYELGASGLQKIIDQTNDAGYAAKVAATRLDNLSGDIEKLGGSVETAALQSGSGLNTWLRDITQGATGAVDAIGSLPAPLLDTAVKATALVGGGLLAGSMLLKLATSAGGAYDAFSTLKEASPRVASGLGKVGKAAGVVGIALAALQVASIFGAAAQAEIDKTKLSLAGTAEALGQLSERGDSTKLDDAFRRINAGASNAALNIAVMSKASKDGTASFLGQADSWIKGLVGLQGNWAANTEQIQKMDQALTAMSPDAAAASYKNLSDQLLNMGMTQEEIAATFPEYKATLVDTANQLDVTTLSAADYADWMGGKVPAAVIAAAVVHPALVTNLTDVQKAAAGGAQTLEEYAKSVWDAANAVLETSGSQVGFERALDNTGTAVDKLVAKAKKAGKLSDLTNVDTELGRQGVEQLDQLATATETYTQKLIKNGGSQDEVRLAVARARAEFIDEATSMGYSKKKAGELADARGLIPKNIKLETTEEGSEAAKERLAKLKDSIKGLPKSAQTKVLSEFEENGIDAAYTALHKIDGKKADAWVKSMLDKGGIDDWKKFKPKDKDAHLKVHMTKSGTWTVNGKNFFTPANGGVYGPSLNGLVQHLADGGFGQPQVRPFQGAAGVNWGEQGSGPWEAFISGAPQKKDRSLAIWRDVGRRLGAFTNAATGAAGAWGAFADGGIAEPVYKGKPLSYWQDQLKTPLEFTQLQIQLRDLTKDLAETETYNPPGKKKKAKRLKLRGLDRTEGQQRLAEDQAEMVLALQAQQLNASKSGTIDAQIAAYEARKDAAETAKTSAAASSSKLMQQYMQGSSADDLLANMNAGAQQVADFQNMMSRLQNQGLNKTMLDYLSSTGSTDLLTDVVSKGKAGIDAFNAVTANLTLAADSLGQSQATGTYAPAPVLSSFTMPGYMTSGAAGSVVNNKQVTFNVSQLDPQGAAVFFDQQLRYL